jgi:succinate dehydrogenase / fumarate reductase membrane anchor subunit
MALKVQGSGTSTTSTPAPTRITRPRASFETWSWFFMRVSGLVLLFLALTHFALTHILHDVASTNYDFVARRWHNLGWRIFDWSLLALALAHGLNGLRMIVDDYVRAPGWRATTKAFVYTLSGVLFAYGTLVIFSFPRA